MRGFTLPEEKLTRHLGLVLLLCLLAGGGCSKEKSTNELIVDLKSSPNQQDRVKAVRRLPQEPEDAAQVVPALIEVLKDKNVSVRRSAAIRLGYIGEEAKQAIPALQAALQDRDARVREAARVALSRIDPKLVPKTAPLKPGGK